MVTTLGNYGTLVQIRTESVKYSQNSEMTIFYDNISWVPSNLPITPTFEMMTVRADPYPDFCKKYDASVNEKVKIAEVIF